MIDLHTHTFLSDGECGPAELVRRAEHAGYRAIGITDHADASNLDDLISSLVQFVRETQPFMKIRIIPGVELTHVPPGQISGLVRRARQLGARLVLLHGESVCEPVALGTNRAGIEAGIDILAHPGIISEEEVRLAAANGVHLEISARFSHGLGNGRVVSLARDAGAALVINSDAHSPSDILTPNWREKVALGSGLTADEMERVNKVMISLVEKLVPSTFLHSQEAQVLIVLTVVNIILIAYLFLLSLRIVLGWFAPQALGKAWNFLTAATDPYLRVFSRIRFLRGSLFDFSPIAAILALVVALDLVNQLLYYGRITVGFFLASLLSAGWSGIRFLLLLFLIVGLLRTIPIAFRATAGANLWRVADTIMQPVIAWVMKVLRLGKRSGYTQHLLLTIGLLFVAWLVGEVVIGSLVSIVQRLPF